MVVVVLGRRDDVGHVRQCRIAGHIDGLLLDGYLPVVSALYHNGSQQGLYVGHYGWRRCCEHQGEQVRHHY